MGKTIRHGDENSSFRNAVKSMHRGSAMAMQKRYGQTTSVMKDRRQPRGGNRNEFRDYLNELEEDNSLPSDNG